MPKYLIEYEVECPDLNEATKLSMEILYLADVKVDKVHVSPAAVESGRTFKERPTIEHGSVAGVPGTLWNKNEVK